MLNTRTNSTGLVVTESLAQRLAKWRKNLPICHPRNFLNMKASTKIVTWNIWSLNATGGARLLFDKLDLGYIEIMSLQEVKWHGAEKIAIDNCYLLWSILSEDQTRQGTVWLKLFSHATSALISWHPLNDRILVVKLKHRFGDFS